MSGIIEERKNIFLFTLLFVSLKVKESNFFVFQTAEPSENDSLVLPPFLGYSPPGVVPSADLMYANYGTVKDFRELDKRNLSCIGKIVIMRYGKIFRGNKVIFNCHLPCVSSLFPHISPYQ